MKFLKAGRVVILLTGRYAGKKAVIVKNFDDGTSARRYGHALVCGLSKEPRKVIKASSQAKQARRSRVKTFIKTVNYQHLMPTRYTLDAAATPEFKAAVTPEADGGAAARAEARKAAKALLEARFKEGKNRWFFSKLRF